MNKILKATKMKRSIYVIILEILMIALSLAVLLPLVFALMQSIKSPAEASKLNFNLPSAFHFENYATVFKEGNIFNAFLLSCIITFSTVVLTVLLSALAAYVINRKVTKVTKLWYLFLVLGLIPPAFPIPTVWFLDLLGIQGTVPGIVLFYTAIFTPFSVFLITGFLKTVPKALDEAAVIDGCKPSGVFFRVILPTIKPVIFTNIIFVFMWSWNDFVWPLYLLNGGADSSTLPLSVYNFIAIYGTKWNYVFADLVLVSLPVILIYTFARRYIIEGMVAGAIKG